MFIINACNLIEVLGQYLNDFEPACGEVGHHQAGETNIVFNDIVAWLLLYYRLTIWTYKVHMHQIPQF